jgi:2-polyprenyl-3-methyl-5-hydroxy-6-metoxy-1,4-benzoquinol methylase
MNNYQKTFETWDKVAALYQTKFMDLDLYNDTYIKFCELINKTNAAIFEIGCGPGNITKHLLATRPDFQIYAIDVSHNMIQLAKANNPTAQFSVMDCREIGSLTLKFDGIISGFCMPYLSKQDNSQFIKDCAGLLERGGIFYFSTIKGDYNNSGFVPASTGDLSYVYYYDEEYLQYELGKNNFETIDLIYKPSPLAVESAQEDMIFIAKKR